MQIFRYITLKNIATLYLFLMSTQYMPIEGVGVSMVKVVAMCLAPLVFVTSGMAISKALIWGAVYYGFVYISAIWHPDTLRYSTLIYHGAFVFTFILFYNLIRCSKVYTSEGFLKVVKGLILTLTVVLLIQQAFMVVGVKQAFILNNPWYLNRGLGAPSLTLEPSHTARIMAVAFLSMLRMYEVKYGTKVTIEILKTDAKWTSIAFLWSMVSMGSGTAFVCLGILVFYFLSSKSAVIVAPLMVAFYFAIPSIENNSLQRAYNIVGAVSTGDQETVTHTDGSASGRINPLLNTIQYLDINDADTWLGLGVDSKRTTKISYIGCIQDYGLLAFVFMQIFIYVCVIRRFWSFESILWLFIFGMAFQNFYYTFGAMMLMAGASYFKEQGVWTTEEIEETEETEEET